MDDFFSEISDDDYWVYECFSKIDKHGRAIDDYGNEFRDPEGQIVIVPKCDWHLFKQSEVIL